MSDVRILDIAGSQWNFKDLEARSEIAALTQKLKDYLTLSPPETINANLLNTSNGWEVPYDGILYGVITLSQQAIDVSISTDNGATWTRIIRNSSSVYFTLTEIFEVQKGWRVKSSLLFTGGVVGTFYKNRD